MNISTATLCTNYLTSKVNVVSMEFYKNIVKPWFKSESKPLSQQTPKSNKSPPKEEKEEFGPWAETIFTWAHINLEFLFNQREN